MPQRHDAQDDRTLAADDRDGKEAGVPSVDSGDVSPPTRGPWYSQRRTLYLMLVVFVVGRVGYDLIERGGLQQTAALYVGLPAAIAAAIIHFKTAATGYLSSILSGVSVALLYAAVVAGQLAICVIMASPLFFAMALAQGAIRWVLRRRDGEDGSGSRPGAAGLALIPFVLLSLEGTPIGPAFDREETVRVVRTIDAAPAEVRSALERPMRHERPLPRFLRLGFPRPVEARGDGLSPGDRWVTTLEIEGRLVELELEVVGAGETWVRYGVIRDDTPISHWMRLRESGVSWRALEDGRTEVEWSLSYTRMLDPIWYFGPLQRFGVGHAVSYLIDAAATP